MRRLGFEYRKPPRIPAQADEQKQQDFIELYQALAKGCPIEEPCYFVDAVHPEHQSHPAYGWFKKGEKVALKSSSGRDRVNIHGAINLANFDVPFVEPSTVDANSTIALFEKIEANKPRSHGDQPVFGQCKLSSCKGCKGLDGGNEKQDKTAFPTALRAPSQPE